MTIESNLHFIRFCATSLLNQSEVHVKAKSIMTCSPAFSRALPWLHAFASSFDWFTGLSVIGQSNYFGFGFAALI